MKSQSKTLALSLSIFLAITLCNGKAQAQDNWEFQRDALVRITSTAENICQSVNQEGLTKVQSGSLSIRSALANLIPALKELGLRLSTDYTKTTFQGVLQTELTSTLKDIRDCRKHVFDVLANTFLNGSASPSTFVGYWYAVEEDLSLGKISNWIFQLHILTDENNHIKGFMTEIACGNPSAPGCGYTAFDIEGDYNNAAKQLVFKRRLKSGSHDLDNTYTIAFKSGFYGSGSVVASSGGAVFEVVMVRKAQNALP